MLRTLVGAFAGGILLAIAVAVLIFGIATDGGSPLTAAIFSLLFCLYPTLWLARQGVRRSPATRYLIPFVIAILPSYLAIGFIGTMNWTAGCALATLVPIWAGGIWGAFKK